jgi:hypothetical protein
MVRQKSFAKYLKLFLFFQTNILNEAIDNYVSTLLDLFSHLNPSGKYDYFQQVSFTGSLTVFMKKFYDLVGLVSGLNDIQSNVAFLMDPKNADIVKGIEKAAEVTVKFAGNPTKRLCLVRPNSATCRILQHIQHFQRNENCRILQVFA